MATKYDWSEVPEEVKWIATDEDGMAWGWDGKPEIRTDEWMSDTVCLAPLPNVFLLYAHENPFKGDWRESLEQRPTN